MIFENFFKRKRGTWLWFWLTFIASFIPVLMRLSVWIDNNVTPFDVKDLLFAGLGLNLSNLNLVGSKDFDERLPIILFSCFLIVIISVRIAAMIVQEAIPNQTTNLLATTITLGIVFVSIFLSHAANKYIFDTVSS